MSGQIFLVQVRGEFDFCYVHLPTCFFYDIDNLYRVARFDDSGNILIRNNVLIEITSDLVIQFKSQPYIVIDENGFGLAEGVDLHNLQMIHGDNNLKNAYIRRLTLPTVQGLLGTESDIEFCLPQYYLVNMYIGFENNLSPLLPPHIDLIYSDNGPFYRHSGILYMPVGNIRDIEPPDYQYITQIEPDTVYYILKSSTGLSIISISHTTPSINIIGSYNSNSKLLDIIRLTQPNMKAIIPNTSYDILPYKRYCLNFDPIIEGILETSDNSDVTIEQLVAILSGVFSGLNSKYHNISPQLYRLGVSELDILRISAFLPEFIIVNDERIYFTSLLQFQKLIQDDEVKKCDINHQLQFLADKSPNRIVTIYLKDGTTYLLKAKFNVLTKRVYNPE